MPPEVVDDSGPESSRDLVFRIMQDAMRLRPWWVVVVVAVTVLSAFRVEAKGATVSVTFSVGTVTAVLMTLIWLPSLLKIVGWTGVSLKTPAGEASSTGLAGLLGNLPPDVRSDVLGTTAASLEDLSRTPDGAHQAEAAKALTAVRQEMVSSAEESRRPLDTRLGELAGQYDTLRGTLPSGGVRTRQLSGLVEQAQAAVKADRAGAEQYLKDRLGGLDGLHGGERVMALAALRAVPTPSGLDAVRTAVSTAESPFEQYQALRACEAIIARYGAAVARPVLPALQAALDGQATVPVRGSDREGIVAGLVRALA